MSHPRIPCPTHYRQNTLDGTRMDAAGDECQGGSNPEPKIPSTVSGRSMRWMPKRPPA